MSISINAAGTALGARSLGSTGAAPSAGQAYQAAVKELRKAQRTLTQDAAAGKGEDVLKGDRAAVAMAAAAVAQAAAALAKEKQQVQRDRAIAHDETGVGSAAANQALLEAATVVDVYT